ncbi:unnamed protein product [Periconia digitata]|uniref:Uncharacterized protein n=1 Tax=Periconia digitata TaxID=1303443 RepID=A0A9W4XKS6_9PLEO|nr:unnamed protein product [Periconia digitata]
MTEYEVAEYMVRLDGVQHPALLGRPGTGVVFDGIRKQWVLESDRDSAALPYDDIYHAAFEARDQLLETCNRYREKMKLPVIDFNASHNWKEVEDSVQNACVGLETLATKDKEISGWQGKFKRAFRGLCNNAGAGRTAANLIPNDSFGLTSVLCGSLKVVFTGLQATGRHRIEVYRTLEDLPQRLKDIAADVSMNYLDRQIHQRAAALYAAAFKLLNHILLWFLKSNMRTGVKLLLDPTGFMDRLQDLQAELKTASQSFAARLDKLTRDSVQETQQFTYSSAYSIHTKLQHIEQAISDERGARLEVLESLKLGLKMVRDELQERNTSTPDRKRIKEIPAINPEKILRRFSYESDLVIEDSRNLVNRAKQSRRTSRDPGRLIALHNNLRLQAWLAVDESSLLFLNGRTESRPDSAVSFFSAQVFQALLESHGKNVGVGDAEIRIIPLAFFCGQHRDLHTDSNANPEEMAMSLLLQLIDRGRNDLDSATLQQCYDKTKGGNVESICSMFETAVTSLGPRVLLVVMVDGLRFFAQPGARGQDTRNVIWRLLRLFRTESDAKIKALFSSPTKCDYLEDLFDEHEVLALPRELAGGRTKSPVEYRLALDEEESGEGSD